VVYLACFADACMKVGISSRDRVLLRWRGQGARLATVLVAKADAYEARAVEENVVRIAGIPEVVRSARKRSSLNERIDLQRARRALEQTRSRVAEVCGLRPATLEVHDLTAEYLGTHALDLPITDLSDERPRSITGVGIGMVGDVLVTEESGRQFMISIKELIGSVIQIELVAGRNRKRPVAGQLGFGFS